MSVIASVAKALLKLDNTVQSQFAKFWRTRSENLRASATAIVRQADTDLTAQLAGLEAKYKRDVERLVRQLGDRKDDDVDKAYARRDINVNDARDDIAVADALDTTALCCQIKAQNAHMAMRLLDGAL